MSVDEGNMQQLVSRLRTVHFQSYLLATDGWKPQAPESIN